MVKTEPFVTTTQLSLSIEPTLGRHRFLIQPSARRVNADWDDSIAWQKLGSLSAN